MKQTNPEPQCLCNIHAESGHVARAPNCPVHGVEAPAEAVPDLYRLAFMPGCFRCPKCQFVLTKACISARSGEVGTREQDRESEPCPNDGTMMKHVTYREQLEVYAMRLRDELDRIEQLRAPLEQIMTMHWDLAACRCWICTAGYAAGCRPRLDYEKWRGTLGYVKVEGIRSA